MSISLGLVVDLKKEGSDAKERKKRGSRSVASKELLLHSRRRKTTHITTTTKRKQTKGEANKGKETLLNSRMPVRKL